MNIVYTCDDNYVWLMGVSMLSLFENNRDMDDIHVWLIGSGITDKSKEELRSIADRYGRKVTVMETPDLDIPPILCTERWPKIVFTRLFTAELLPEDVDRALYLDCDTIVRGDISALEDYDTKGMLFSGVKDCIGHAYRKNIGLSDTDIYINSGVLLLDLCGLRKLDIRPLVESTAWKYKDFITYADQDLMNTAFRGQTGTIPAKYNLMTIASQYSRKEIQLLRRPVNYYSEEEYAKMRRDPRIIHYTTNMLTVRPWFSDSDHPYAEDFRRYLAMSPWADRKLKPAVFNKKEHRIIRAVQVLPGSLSDRTLGFLHTAVRPIAARIKAFTKGA